MAFIIIACALILDRLTKILAIKYLAGMQSFPIIKNVLHLTYTRNTGAAFSLFSGKSIYLALFSVFVIALLCVFLFNQKKKNPKNKLYISSIAMIIGGALGNMVDRFAYGYVVDFFDFTLINFAIFNVADIFITLGGIIFCVKLLFDKKIKL